MAISEDKQTPESDVSPPRGKGIPKIAIYLAIALFVAGAGFFVGKIIFGGPAEPAAELPVIEAGTEVKPSEDARPPQEIRPGILQLDEFTVNLNDPFGRRYANLHIGLEIENRDLVSRIREDELLMPRIRDMVFMIVSAKGYNELNTVSGKITLKEEIQIRLNEIIKPVLGREPVRDVYFSKFLIQ